MYDSDDDQNGRKISHCKQVENNQNYYSFSYSVWLGYMKSIKT